MGFQPYIEHSPTADAVYVYLSDAEVEHTRKLDDWRMVDYDTADNPVGVEFLGISAGVEMHDVPEQRIIERLLGPLNLRLYA